MASTKSKPLPDYSWSSLRRQANSMGIPAWQLAEDLSFHAKDGELLVKITEKEKTK